MAKKSTKEKKIFVLDTSVLLHDHNAVNNFEEHDVAIPITVLEELDRFKKGNDSLNFEAREFIRFLDRLSQSQTLTDWIALEGVGKGMFCVEMHERAPMDANDIFGEIKDDHRILNTALYLHQEHPAKKVVLVSKDVNLRLKAKALGLAAEDYRFGKVKNLDELYTGKTVISGLSSEVIDRLYQDGYCMPEDVGLIDPIPNHYFILRNGKDSVLAYFNAFDGRLEKVEKRLAYGIKPRNAEQTFALHAVMAENIRLVTIQGTAGTGKTLLALAGALEQKRLFKQLYVARPIVPLSNKDIGYLPGDIKSKLNPYMEPLWDNLKLSKISSANRTKTIRKSMKWFSKKS